MMSDCSREAFLPKEQPVNRDPFFFMLDGAGYEMQFDDSAQSENWRQGIEGINWDAVKWVEIDGSNFVSEQRYAQLEQVAKGMLDFIERVEQTAYEEFSDQLRDCGVIIDD